SDDFAARLADIKAVLADDARAIRMEVTRFEGLLGETDAALADTRAALEAARINAPGDVATLEGRVAKLTADAASLTRQIENLSAQAVEMEARAGAADAPEQLDERLPSLVVEIDGGVVKATEIGNDYLTGDVLIPLTAATPAAPGDWRLITFATPEGSRKLSDRELVWLTALDERGVVSTGFNWGFFTSGDSR